MTIASHCLELLSRRSPLSAEELGQACLAAGLTRARNPVAAVTTALHGHVDVAPLLPDARYGFTLTILEGSWFTTRHRVGDRLAPSLDIALLTTLLSHRTLPLASGGEVGSSRHGDGLRGPAGWLPKPRDGEVVALRIHAGELDVRSAVLGAEASARGQDLASRLRLRMRSSSMWWQNQGIGREREVWRALVPLVAEEPDVLSVPVPPLSDLLPDLVHRPEAVVELADPTTIALPLALRDRLQALAADVGLPLSRWLTQRLEELADDARCSGWAHGSHSEPWGDDAPFEPWDSWGSVTSQRP